MAKSGQFSRRLLRHDLSHGDLKELATLIEGCEARLGGTQSETTGTADLRHVASGSFQGLAAFRPGDADSDSGAEALEGRLWALLQACGDSAYPADRRQIAMALVHEMLQPLTAISNYVAACHHLLSPDADDRLAGALTRIAGQIDRALRIAERIRENAA